MDVKHAQQALKQQNEAVSFPTFRLDKPLHTHDLSRPALFPDEASLEEKILLFW